MTLTSNKLEPAIWSRGTGQQIAWFDGCQLIITWRYISKTYKGNQGCMSLSTYYLEYGCHLAQLHHRRRCRHRAYTPTSNTTSHDNHKKINPCISFSFLYGYGASLGSPSGRWSSDINVKPEGVDPGHMWGIWLFRRIFGQNPHCQAPKLGQIRSNISRCSIDNLVIMKMSSEK